MFQKLLDCAIRTFVRAPVGPHLARIGYSFGARRRPEVVATLFNKPFLDKNLDSGVEPFWLP
jgi:hypothetical protein